MGVEEEYLLVDRQTGGLLSDPDPSMFVECQEALGPQVSPEFLRAQIEVGTRVCSNVQEVRSELTFLRTTLSAIAERHGAAIIASSTHPSALWWEQMPTDKDRYKVMVQDLGWVARRLVICGMHVHVAIEDPDMRIDLMNQVKYFLPHLLALSTSSPFWGSRNTGLRSYRLNVFRTLPRTGVPEDFTSWADYRRHVDVLTRAGIIEDASKLWWDIRPSERYPTLEMRVSDICTRVEDTVTIAAAYVSFLAYLVRLRASNQRWRQYANMLIAENIWRAQRYGCRGTLMDYGKGELVAMSDLVEEMVDIVGTDAESLGCLEELKHARTIVAQGTSAERQIDVYEKALAEGADNDQAIQEVIKHLMEDTLHGL